MNKPGRQTKSVRSRKKQLKVFKQHPSYGAIEDTEIDELKELYNSIDSQAIVKFSDFPLSKKTLKGLLDCDYKKPTDIQRESIGLALQGKDILGAAVTGRGKTLAFLVPVLECLFIRKWSRMDGIGALIISPTRELAYQIFETLKKVGAHHDFSAGLIIGGKNLKFERSRMDQCNILICTPGRLLQHMDENPLFSCDKMQILVLDEADRCLDLGFEKTMNGIIDNLPCERQTLLFSATQTKSVKDLARLSLNEPRYVAPHDAEAKITPDTLNQNYVVVELQDKITMVWSFLRSHLKQKCIVFLSSCKQVKYIYEMFCKLRPGMSLLALYGTLHQDRRVAVYNEFCRKSSVVLFATDVASRGLDFPVVNWVIQLDCPEDTTAYIHRAGRTARHTARGESLLVLLPSEEQAMIAKLEECHIKISKITIDARRMFSPRAKMEAFLAQQQELKATAQRAFVAYIKSVALMKNKSVFDVNALDTDAFAHSLGLAVVPRVRFLQRIKKRTNPVTDCASEKEDDGNESEDNVEEADKQDDKRSTVGISYDDDNSDDDDDDDLLTVKRKNHDLEDDGLGNVLEMPVSRSKAKTVTRAALAKKVVKKKILANSKVTFDESGETVHDTAKEMQSAIGREYVNSADAGIDIEQAKAVLNEEDKYDKSRFKMLSKIKRRDQKRKLQGKEDEQQDEFGSDNDDMSDGPDMSWLPDPSEVYGDAEETAPSDDGSDEEDKFHRPPQSAALLTKSTGKRNRSPERSGQSKKSKHDKKNELSKLSLADMEELAMHLIDKS